MVKNVLGYALNENVMKIYKNRRYRLTKHIGVQVSFGPSRFELVGKLGEEIRIIEFDYVKKRLLVQPIRYDKQFYITRNDLERIEDV